MAAIPLVLLDLPFSAVGDTLYLPVTIHATLTKEAQAPLDPNDPFSDWYEEVDAEPTDDAPPK
jgi:hypothetical protein